jgi:hypothetical protein
MAAGVDGTITLVLTRYGSINPNIAEQVLAAAVVVSVSIMV